AVYLSLDSTLFHERRPAWFSQRVDWLARCSLHSDRRFPDIQGEEPMNVATTAQRLRLWVCLATFLLGLVITSCSTGNSSSNGPVDLTLWANPSASEVGNPPSNWFLIQDVKKALNINLHVTLIPYGDAGNAKYSAAAAANSLPDLFGIQFSTTNSD